jgi:hypothetical protein
MPSIKRPVRRNGIIGLLVFRSSRCNAKVWLTRQNRIIRHVCANRLFFLTVVFCDAAIPMLSCVRVAQASQPDRSS